MVFKDETSFLTYVNNETTRLYNKKCSLYYWTRTIFYASPFILGISFMLASIFVSGSILKVILFNLGLVTNSVNLYFIIRKDGDLEAYLDKMKDISLFRKLFHFTYIAKIVYKKYKKINNEYEKFRSILEKLKLLELEILREDIDLDRSAMSSWYRGILLVVNGIIKTLNNLNIELDFILIDSLLDKRKELNR